MDWKNESWGKRNTVLADKTYSQDILTKIEADREISEYEYSKIKPDNSLAILHDPFLMTGMAKASAVVYTACQADRRIFIHGDYDADGLTSSAILYIFFKRLAVSDVRIFIPDRLEDGYGLSADTAQKVKEYKADLLITVDCGIRSVAEIKDLEADGITTVVTDHHLPGAELPDATALIDPHIEEDNYPCENLAGAGVAFKLCQAVVMHYGLDKSLLDDLAALAMIGTVADVMPLRDENRHIVSLGLLELKAGSLVAVRVLAESLNLCVADLNAEDFAFKICPRINACGRMGQNQAALDLLLCSDRSKACKIVQSIEEINTARKAAQDRAITEIDHEIEAHPEILHDPLILLRGDDWHTGVLGIIAARIQDKWQKPCIVCTVDPGKKTAAGGKVYRGSGRSEGEFNLFKVIAAAAEYLTEFGGHQNACGLSVAEKDWAEFKSQLEKAALIEHERLEQNADFYQDMGNTYKYDLEFDPDVIDIAAYYKLNELEPFGEANKRPVLLFRNLEIDQIFGLSEDKHVKFSFKNSSGSFSGLAFFQGNFLNLLKPGDKISVLATLKLNKWGGRTNIQLMIEHIIYPGEEDLIIAKCRPNRETKRQNYSLKTKINGQDLINVWRVLAMLLADNKGIISLERLQNLITLYTKQEEFIQLDLLNQILDIFAEAGLISKYAQIDDYTFYLKKSEPLKRSKLSSTSTAQELIMSGVLLLDE